MPLRCTEKNERIFLTCPTVLVHNYFEMAPRGNKADAFQFRLDLHTGVPVYRQLIDQVMLGIAAGTLSTGDQLPTVRQLAVDLSVNPNTVARAYRELEIRGVLQTQQGSGTFIGDKKPSMSEAERQRHLDQLVGDFLARAAGAGFTVKELLQTIESFESGPKKNRR
jgi:GntR family transcriptional regulator